MKREWVYGIAVLAVLPGGCVQVEPPDRGDVSVAVPETWMATGEAGLMESSWLAVFGDAGLQEAVEEAFSRNLSLQSATARLDQALALARIEGADRWPSLSATGSAGRSQSLIFQNPPFQVTSDRFEVAARVSWELDIWGRVRAQAMGAGARAFAAEADFQAFRLSLASLVAQAWFSAIEARLQEDLARETLVSFESNRITVEERFQRGLTPAQDLRLSNANVAGARATLAQRERAADLAVRQLEALLGRYPSGSLEMPAQLPLLEGPLRPGVPADLMMRRPDIEAASQRVVAAQAGLIESRRSLLPAISLTGSYGRASSELEDLLDADFDIWNLAGNLTAPLFQGGRLRANVDLNEAALAEALADYRETALTAFREVESALAAEAFLRDQLEALRTAADESLSAQELSEERYSRGLTDIITVLETQRRAFNARLSLLAVQNQLLQNRLTLYLALGGAI